MSATAKERRAKPLLHVGLPEGIVYLTQGSFSSKPLTMSLLLLSRVLFNMPYDPGME
jgi:hypothetical protein